VTQHPSSFANGIHLATLLMDAAPRRRIRINRLIHICEIFPFRFLTFESKEKHFSSDYSRLSFFFLSGFSFVSFGLAWDFSRLFLGRFVTVGAASTSSL